MKKNVEKQMIDEIVSQEALDQLDLLKSKLDQCVMLEKKLGGSVALKVSVLSDLLGLRGSEKMIDLNTYKLVQNKLQELIPLL